MAVRRFCGDRSLTNADLQELFSAPPASFHWSQSVNGWRAIGSSEGAILDIWPDHAELTATFPPDNAELAARNGTLMQLLLVALRPEWQSGSAWLSNHMRMAARSRRNEYEVFNYSRGVRFRYDREHSKAALRITTSGPSNQNNA